MEGYENPKASVVFCLSQSLPVLDFKSASFCNGVLASFISFRSEVSKLAINKMTSTILDFIELEGLLFIA